MYASNMYLPVSPPVNYNYSITFVGDPKTAFAIGVTQHNANYSQYIPSHWVEVFHLTDSMIGNKAIGIRCSMAQLALAIYKINPDGSAEDENEVIPYFDTDATIVYLPLTAGKVDKTLSKISSAYSQEKCLLIPWYTDSLLFKVDGCYSYNALFNTMPLQTSFNPQCPISLKIDNKKFMLFNTSFPYLLYMNDDEPI